MNQIYSLNRLWVALLLLILLKIPFLTNAQQNVSKWVEENKKNQNYSEQKAFLSTPRNYDRNPNGVAKGLNLDIDKNIFKKIADNPPASLTLPVPMGNGLVLNLELARVNITAPNFKVTSSNGNSIKNEIYKEGLYYRGIVKGDNSSLVSINFIDNEISGFISYAGKKFMIGKLKDNSEEHVLYDDVDLKAPKNYACASNPKNNQTKSLRESATSAVAGVGCKTVKVYFECDYAMYVSFGSNVTNVVNYVNGFFSQVATLYANDNIDLQISEIKVWTTTDTYATLGSTYDILMAFDNNGSNYNGDLAHFLTTRNLGGGIAYVDVLCNKSAAYGVSAIATIYATVPTYSWTVECVAHELGHNIGSNHTQWCGWTRTDGTTGPLDNCYPAEGTCATTGATPTNGGTVMSYCHLTGYGINFSNGFGTVPGNLLRSRVQNSTCLVSTGAAPSGLASASITSTGATVSWLAVSGATNYTVEYKLNSATTWTTLASQTTLSKSLTGLQSGSIYNWRVKTDCSVASASVSFTTTTAACSAPTGLSNTTPTSNSTTLNWAAVSGATGYTIQYKTSSATTWTTVSSTTNSYSLTGLSASTTYNWQVMANCSGYATGTAFTTIAASCSAPAGLSSSSITSNSATVSWTAVSGAANYTLQYKSSASTTWITASSTITATSYNLTGLSASTAYNWQVKANCSTTFTAANFSTIAASCSAAAGLTSSSITSNSATVSWTAVSGAANYTLQYKSSTSTTWITASSTITASSYNLTGLLASTAYNWQVKANCSTTFTAANFSTIAASCSAAAGLTSSSITSNSATVSWTAVSGAANYTLQYKSTSSTTWITASSTITSTSYNLTGLSASTAYNWQVKANCSTTFTAANFSTIAASCSAAVGLTSSSITSNSATVSWTAVSGAANYTLQYKSSTSTTWITASSTITASSYNLTGLSASTAYNWQVKANCSTTYTAANFTTIASTSCSLPVGMSTTNLSYTSATLVWNAVSGATNYTIQYKANSSSIWITANNGNSVATTNFNLTGLTANTAYNWRVKANCSNNTANVNFTTLSPDCSVPTNLTANSLTATSVVLGWGAKNGITSYTLQYKLSTNSNWTSVTVTTNTRNITGLTAGRTYNWRVKSSCSNNSSTASFSTPAAIPAGTKNGKVANNNPFGSSLIEFSIYPNPSEYEVKLKVAEEESGEGAYYRILDLGGNLKKSVKASEDDVRIDISDLQEGTYIVQFISKSGKVSTQRLVKQ
jgi:hypothetical protein